MTWVKERDWQTWTAEMIDATKDALAAIDAQDQEMLGLAGERLVESCEGCHAAYKPDVPTEGILHVPHHEYGDPLNPQ